MTKKKALKMKFNPSEKRSIVKFNSGVPNPNTKFVVQQYVKNDDTTSKLMHIQRPHVGYFGYNEEIEQGYTMLVVEHDEENNTAQFFEADSYDMKPLLPEYLPKHLQESKSDKKKQVKKKKDKAEETANNTATINKPATVVIEGINGQKLSQEIPVNDISNDEETLLPCNRNATNLKDVYGGSQLIPDQVLASLAQKYGDKLITNSKIDEVAVREEKFEDYVTKILLNPPSHLKEENEMRSYVVSCKIISLMIKVYSIRSADLKKPSCLEHEPEDVRKWLFSTFSVGEGKHRQIPTNLKHMTLGLAMVVMWTHTNYRFPANDMRKAFEAGEKLFNKTCRRLLGKVQTLKVEGEMTRLCILSLPLPKNVPTPSPPIKK